MKQLSFFLLSAIAFLCQTTDMKAQDVKELVVVMNRNYTYQDPRWESSVVLKKGEAITVINEKGANYDYWPYPAANVAIPKKSPTCLVLLANTTSYLTALTYGYAKDRR